MPWERGASCPASHPKSPCFQYLERKVITSEQIEAWVQEAQQRPESAALLVQYIATRLRNLAVQNEELLAENIALQSGKRVEEYEGRIAHLEYQLDLLKRQLGGELPAAEAAPAAPKATPSLLLYNAFGRVLRVNLPPETLAEGARLGRIGGAFNVAGEAPRLRVAAPNEELLLVFTSGRVSTLSVSELPLVAPRAENPWDWESSPLPDEPRAGEALACIAPVSRLALADVFVQASRRGFVKKIGVSLAQSIFANRYIGAGVNQRADQTFALNLCARDDRLALVSREGYLACLEVKGLPFSIEEAIRLAVTDHLIAACILGTGRSLLAMTQTGKLIQREVEGLESVNLKTRGQALFSAARREQGTRLVGAGVAAEGDWAVALHNDGLLSLHPIAALVGRGTLPTEGELLAFSTFSA